MNLRACPWSLSSLSVRIYRAEGNSGTSSVCQNYVASVRKAAFHSREPEGRDLVLASVEARSGEGDFDCNFDGDEEPGMVPHDLTVVLESTGFYIERPDDRVTRWW